LLLLETAADPRGSLLQGCTLFSTFSAAALADLAARATSVTAAEGEILFRQGELGGCLYLIVSGSVRLSSKTANGFEQPIALHGPSSCFGEMALLDGEPRSATAVAVRSSELLRVDREALDVVLDRHPRDRERYLSQGVRLVSSRLRDANDRYWVLAGQNLRAKADVAQSRSRLMSLMSHELRTPLTIIKNSAQRLRPMVEGAAAPLAERIERQCGRLELLIDDLITLSLLQGSSRLQESAEVDLAKVAAEVAAEMRSAAEAKRLRLSLILTPGDALVMADRSLVRRALRHLVDNAIKFSRAPGDVRLEVKPAVSGGWGVSVVDLGTGIERRALDRLMLSFVQWQDPLNRDVEGLGIGLSLANEVARVHQGRLLVDSMPGSGSRFTLELPSKPEESTEPAEASVGKEYRK
jgi:signal transduction histidine kinase